MNDQSTDIISEVRPIWGGFTSPQPTKVGPQPPGRSAPPIRPGRGTTAVGTPPATHPLADAHQTRTGSIHAQADSADAKASRGHGRAIVLNVNTKFATVAATAGAVAAFVGVVMLGSLVPPSEANAGTARADLAPAGSIPLAFRMEQAESLPPLAPQPAASPISGLSLDEYGRQVAIATLTSGLHEITNTSITFYRDPDQPGNAVQQFARKFGRAIATGQNPTPLSGQDAPR
ncbi:MAG: hypothetical protein AAGF47_09005 [Planctomycetota bacterium]